MLIVFTSKILKRCLFRQAVFLIRPLAVYLVPRERRIVDTRLPLPIYVFAPLDTMKAILCRIPSDYLFQLSPQASRTTRNHCRELPFFSLAIPYPVQARVCRLFILAHRTPPIIAPMNNRKESIKHPITQINILLAKSESCQ